MNMKSYLVFFILFLSGNFIGLKAQSSLLMETSLPRDRDTLIMQQVTFCAPGDSGTNVTWDFRDLEYLDVEKRVFYKGRLDSILCMYRNKTAYKYRLSGDSLLFLGYENPVTKMCFVSPVPVLRFPFYYGDTIASPFIGNGGYSHVYSLKSYGYSETVADASGILFLPGEDTLRNVIRLHSKERVGLRFIDFDIFGRQDSLFTVSSIGDRLTADSVIWQVDTYRWYLPGYRYPVLETIENTIDWKSKSVRHFFISMLYSLEEQRSLDRDSENEQVRERIFLSDKKYQGCSERSGALSDMSDLFSLSCKIDPVGNRATVYAGLNRSSRMEILLANMSGSVLYHESPRTVEPGYYVSDIDYDRYSETEFIITVIIGDKRESWKIKKR